MTSEPSNEDNDADTWRKYRRKLIEGAGLALAMIGLFVLYAYAGRLGVWSRLGFSHAEAKHFGAFVLAPVLVVGILFIAYRKRNRGDLSEASVIRHMAYHHSRFIIGTIVLMAVTGWQIVSTFPLHHPGAPVDSLHMAVTGIMIFSLALVVAFGPLYFSRTLRKAFDEEFVRALRAKAIRVGYLALMLAGGAAVILVYLHPDETAAVLCWTLYGGLAVPILYYAFLDWRAGHGD